MDDGCLDETECGWKATDCNIITDYYIIYNLLLKIEQIS